MSDYRLDEPYNPDNEDPPDDERTPCAECGHRMADDLTDPVMMIGPYFYCEDCWRELSEPDPFDDAEYDQSKEE